MRGWSADPLALGWAFRAPLEVAVLIVCVRIFLWWRRDGVEGRLLRVAGRYRCARSWQLTDGETISVWTRRDAPSVFSVPGARDTLAYRYASSP
jgi:hypothetical protein